MKTDADALIDERMNVYNNLSVAQLKVGNSEDALTSAEIVLRLQPNNVKALFRKGKVRIISSHLIEITPFRFSFAKSLFRL